MKRLTAPGIRNYLIKNYGIIKHDEFALLYACRDIAHKYKVSPLEIFHFLIERKAEGRMGVLLAYGFETREGRALRAEIELAYYDYAQDI